MLSTSNSTRFSVGDGLLLLVFALAGVVAALWVLPVASQLLVQSLAGEDAKGYWFIARATGLVAYLLFWLSMVLGLLMSGKLVRQWIALPTLIALHEFTSILGWCFSLVHALVLMGDSYIKFGWVEIFVPWMNTAKQVNWIALGQIAFYALGMILLSFYARQRIGMSAWRWLHLGTFISYMLITVHGLLAGSDAQTPLMMTIYAASNATVLFLTLYRMLLMHQSTT